MVILSMLTIGAHAQTLSAPEIAARTDAKIGALLGKNPPPLFAWHLRSVRALIDEEFLKLNLGVDQSPRQTVADRTKEFIDWGGTILAGLERDCDNPDDYLKNGRRSLILARPSAMDGSLQYMMVGLPKGWDPNREYPLSVGLHGTGPDNPLAYPSFGFGPLGPEGPPDPDPMIGLTPWGRGNRGWRDDSERDLFEAIRLLHTFAKTNPDRWYLSGHSAGGDGTWAIVEHTPDLWAAAGIQSGSMISGRPEWGLAENLAYVPIYWLIGEKDSPERVGDSKAGYALVKQMGGQSELNILPGIGHYPLTPEGYAAQDKWMHRFTRRRPDRFSFTVDQSAHPGVWGISVDLPGGRPRFIKEPWPKFTVAIVGRDVTITTEHCLGLRIDLGKDGLRLPDGARVIVDGKVVHDGPVPDKPLDVKLP